jgi:hypothetical protein
MPGDELNRFHLWGKENLAKFAQDATEKLNAQEQEIQRLREDLKVAIEAYRDLVRRVG